MSDQIIGLPPEVHRGKNQKTYSGSTVLRMWARVSHGTYIRVQSTVDYHWFPQPIYIDPLITRAPRDRQPEYPAVVLFQALPTTKILGSWPVEGLWGQWEGAPHTNCGGVARRESQSMERLEFKWVPKQAGVWSLADPAELGHWQRQQQAPRRSRWSLEPPCLALSKHQFRRLGAPCSSAASGSASFPSSPS